MSGNLPLVLRENKDDVEAAANAVAEMEEKLKAHIAFPSSSGLSSAGLSSILSSAVGNAPSVRCNGTSHVHAQQIFDGSFKIIVDGAETRKERSTVYTMYRVVCTAVGSGGAGGDIAANNSRSSGSDSGSDRAPIEVVVMRRYSDFRRIYDTVRVALPLIHENLPVFPSKAFKFGMNQEAIIAKRVESLQIWLQAVAQHAEAWRLREFVEFLDDSQIISSRLKWTWDNWQSPVLPVTSTTDLEQLQMENLFLVLSRGSSVLAQGVIPMRDYVSNHISASIDDDSKGVGQPFSIVLTRHGLHMGKLRGRVLVRRHALREAVLKELALRERPKEEVAEARAKAMMDAVMGDVDLAHATGETGGGDEDKVKKSLDKLTNHLTVELLGSIKVLAGGKSGKAYTTYTVSLQLDGRLWTVHRRYSQFNNLSKIIIK